MMLSPFRFYYKVFLPAFAMAFALVESYSLAAWMMMQESDLAFLGGVIQFSLVVVACAAVACVLWRPRKSVVR
jgi:hypothetical protein